MDRDDLKRLMPDIAVSSYVATGLVVVAAGVTLTIVPNSPAVVTFFRYVPPVLALTAGAATAAAPRYRMPHRLFWGTAALFLIGPALWLAGVDVNHSVGITIRFVYGAGMLLGGGLWLRQRRAIPQLMAQPSN
jgi:hypothetical protein